MSPVGSEGLDCRIDRGGVSFLCRTRLPNVVFLVFVQYGGLWLAKLGIAVVAPHTLTNEKFTSITRMVVIAWLTL